MLASRGIGSAAAGDGDGGGENGGEKKQSQRKRICEEGERPESDLSGCAVIEGVENAACTLMDKIMWALKRDSQCVGLVPHLALAGNAPGWVP